MIMLAILPSYAGGHRSHNKGIPNDFDARNMVLLIEDSPNERKSEKMERVMKKFYPYKYKIELKEDVRGMRRDTAYADRSVYRYILGNDEHLYTTSEGQHVSFEVYSLYDMKEEKNHLTIRAGNGFSAGTFKHDIKVLVRFMRKLK